MQKYKCWCYNCATPEYRMSHMIVCPTCGNKRCPRATDHRFTCTNSNEPGQPGSRYGIEEKKVYQIEPGDWVRFYNNGKLVIGQVEYVMKERIPTLTSFDTPVQSGFEVKTDIGSVNSGYILEVRKKRA